MVGKDASPLEYLLGSLAACINVIGHMVAKDPGFAIDYLTVAVDGDIDKAKFQGEASEPRAGFQEIRVDVVVHADADQAELDAWLDQVTERCPVADNLQFESALSKSVRPA